MGLVTAISNATDANWLKETLTIAYIRASRCSPRKASRSWVASQEASIKTMAEA